jgi:hypothetical protein
VRFLPDHGRRGLWKECNLGEAGLAGGGLQAAERFGVGGFAVGGIGPGEDDWMADDHRAGLLAGGVVGLALEPREHHADQRPDREVRGPRVGAGEAQLGKLVFDARQQAGVVAAAAFAVLAAVRVPAVRRQRTVPAVGLLVTRDEEGPQRLVTGGAAPGAMEVDERGQRPCR